MREPKFEIKRPVAPTAIDRMHRALCEQEETGAVDPNQFRDLFGNGNVEDDLRYVEEKEEQFKKGRDIEMEEARKLAEIFETIFCEQAELSDWLGPNAFTVKASRYDDIKNGVDVVAEFQGDETSAPPLTLAIDVMVGQGWERKLQGEKGIKNKKGIKDNIKEGKLTWVKYFVSEATDEKKVLREIPKIIIGVGAETVEALAGLWLDGKKKALGKHPIQFQILEEIALQLEAFKQYAEKIRRIGVAKIYEHMSKIIQDIRIKKLSSMADSGWRDKSFIELKKSLMNLDNL